MHERLRPRSGNKTHSGRIGFQCERHEKHRNTQFTAGLQAEKRGFSVIIVCQNVGYWGKNHTLYIVL